jgi:putative ABC transport system permease protein
MRVLTSIGRDLRFALRLMRQTPVVSGVALLSLALGIGANVAIFSLVNALLLKTLPVHEPERLVLLTAPQPKFPERPPFSYWSNPQWEYLRDHTNFMAGMAAVANTGPNLNAGGESRLAAGMYVSRRFFDVLGVTPHIGRTFTDDDDRRGGGAAGPVAVLSHGFWQRQFGGDASAVGRTIHLDGHAFTVIGVTPPEFLGVEVGRAFDVAIPLGTEPILRGADSLLDRRSSVWLRIVGRLAPGQTIAQAEAQLEVQRHALREATLPPDYRAPDLAEYLSVPFTFDASATGVSNLRSRYSRPLFVLLGIVALVLLIACANMANLLLAQSAARQRELVVRLSLGASRWQLVRQLFFESLLLACVGAAAGLLLALWASRALVRMLSMPNNPVVLDLAIDWRVLGFATVVGVATALLFGVAPALRATRLTPAEALRDRSHAIIAGGSRLGLGHGLVALQVALSFVLVFGAGLFVRTLVGLTTQEMGFQPARVLVADVDLRRTTLAGVDRPAFFERLREHVETAPGVEAAAVSVVTPVGGSMWNTTIEVPGYDAPERQRAPMVNAVTPHYFSVMSTPILTGRDIDPTDGPGTPTVALVNEAFAQRFFNGQNPVGKTFFRRAPSQSIVRAPTALAPHQMVQLEIIGLVADAKYNSLREAPLPTIYLAWLQQPTAYSEGRLSVRLHGPVDAFRPTVLGAIMEVEKESVVTFRSLDEDLRRATLQERLVASLSAVFGVLALLLAAIGLYGVMSYSVTRRRNEIGIRMALGAEPGRVMRLVLGHVVTITIVGLVAGIAFAIGAGRFVNALLFGLATTDATMIAMAAVALGVAAVIAGYLPARRAARVDPMLALRQN